MVSHFNDYNIQGINENGAIEQYISCPKCSRERKKKRSKCLSVNTQKEVWLCHHCGWKGSLKDGGNYSDPHWIKPDYRKPKLLPANPKIIPKVMQWFLDRGISAQTQLACHVTVSMVYMPQVEKEVKAIGFPYFRDGEHINTKWRDQDKHFRLEAGAELLLYGLDDLKDCKQVIWVEGEMDKLSLYEAGIKNAVSVPNGAPPPESKSYSSHFDYLKSAEKFLTGKEHIFFLDADPAGRHLEQELSRRLGKELCKRVRLPDGFKDANEYLVAMGREALKGAVDNAQPFPVSGIHNANSLVDGVNALFKGGMQAGASTGWLPLDEFYTVKLGEMTVLTGIPNNGKSNWLDCLMINLVKSKGWRFGVFSPENQPLSRHAAGLLEKLTETTFNSITKSDIDVGMGILQEHFEWILPEIEDDWSLEGILSKAKTLVYRFGINGLVLDPWNEIEHRRPSTLSETEYISSALMKIRQFARLHNVHIWIVAHPTKMRKDDKTGQYPPPTPYDISGSSNWRNKADCAVTIHRKGLSNLVEVHVQKIRFKEVGKIGCVTLQYDVDSTVYREVSEFERRS